MPVKRRAAKSRLHRITPEAIGAFKVGDHLALHRARGLKPWQPSPLEVSPGEPCPWPDGSAGGNAWPLAIELRRELETARRGPHDRS